MLNGNRILPNMENIKRSFLLLLLCLEAVSLFPHVSGETGRPMQLRCADDRCEVKIAEGRTTQRYTSNKKTVLSCKADEEVQIYGKFYNTNNKLLKVMINEVEGFLPARFVRESKVVVHDDKLHFLVPFDSENKIIPPNQQAVHGVDQMGSSVLNNIVNRHMPQDNLQPSGSPNHEHMPIDERQIPLPALNNGNDMNMVKEQLLNQQQYDTPDSSSPPQVNYENPPILPLPVGNEDDTIVPVVNTPELLVTENNPNQFDDDDENSGDESLDDESLDDETASKPIDKQMEPEVSAFHQDTQDPAVNPDTRDPAVNPDTREPAINQHTREPAINPDTRDPAINPDTRDPAVNQHTRDPAFNQHTRDPAFNQHTRDPAFNPDTRDTAVNPDTRDPAANPDTRDPAANPDTRDPAVNPDTQMPAFNPNTQPTMEVVPQSDSNDRSPSADSLSMNPAGHSDQQVENYLGALPKGDSYDTPHVVDINTLPPDLLSINQQVLPTERNAGDELKEVDLTATTVGEVEHKGIDQSNNIVASSDDLNPIETENVEAKVNPDLPSNGPSDPSISTEQIKISEEKRSEVVEESNGSPTDVDSETVMHPSTSEKFVLNSKTLEENASTEFPEPHVEPTQTFLNVDGTQIPYENFQDLAPEAAFNEHSTTELPLQTSYFEDSSFTSTEETPTIPSPVVDETVVKQNNDDTTGSWTEDLTSSIMAFIGSNDSEQHTKQGMDGYTNPVDAPINKQLEDTNSQQEFSEPKQESVIAVEAADNSTMTSQPAVEAVKSVDETVSQSVDVDLKKEIESLPFVDPEMTVSEDLNVEPFVDAPSEKIPHNDAPDTPSLLEGILGMAAPLVGNDLFVALEETPQHLPTGSPLLMTAISLTIVLLYTINLFINKCSREEPLIAAVNTVKREMRLTAEQNLSLQKKCATNNGQHSAPMPDRKELAKMQSLQKELQKMEAHYQGVLQGNNEKIQHLEQELEESTTNGMEMHKMLNELLSSQKEASNFQASVDSLQKMLDDQREKVESLTSDLAMKTRLLKTTQQKSAKLEYQIEQLTHSLEEVNTAKHDALKKVEDISSLEDTKLLLSQELDNSNTQRESLSQQLETLKSSLRKVKSTLNGKEAELQVSKECLKKLQIASGKGKKHELSELFDIVEVKAKLVASQRENDSVSKEFNEAQQNQLQLQTQLNDVQNEIVQLRRTQQTATEQRNDAVSKLEVLTKYFKEKENELTKELESQECLRVDAEGSVSSTASKIQTYQMELESCRSQIDTLKCEIEEQKQSYKMQLTKEGEKAHDSWLAARAAERRQDELRQETAQLRQRLTLMGRDTDAHGLVKPLPKRAETNGNISSHGSTDGDLDRNHTSPFGLDASHLPHLPPHMLPPPMFPGGMPPPPMGGMPPPPPHMMSHFPHPLHMPPDGRLPPAGRIASPPFRRQGSPPGFDRRSYSPSSDHSHYSDRRYSPSHNSTGRYSPSGQRRSSPDRRHMYDHRGEHIPSPPITRDDRLSPDRWFDRSVDGYKRSKNYYNNDISPDDRRPIKGQKTSTPLGPNER